MTDWFYATAEREQRGPLSAEQLVELFAAGGISRATLVWREGLEEWRPLQQLAAELGLPEPEPEPATPPPPPLPSQTTPAPTPTAFQAQLAASATRPRSGMSGCMIALIVVAVLAIPLIAILAAIAIPAYSTYVQRSRVVSALAVAAPLKAQVVEFQEREGHCADNGSEGFRPAADYAAGAVSDLKLGAFENGHCGMELRLHAPGQEAIDRKLVWLEYDGSAWQCSSEIKNDILPPQCRSE